MTHSCPCEQCRKTVFMIGVLAVIVVLFIGMVMFPSATLDDKQQALRSLCEYHTGMSEVAGVSGAEGGYYVECVQAPQFASIDALIMNITVVG